MPRHIRIKDYKNYHTKQRKINLDSVQFRPRMEQNTFSIEKLMQLARENNNLIKIVVGDSV